MKRNLSLFLLIMLLICACSGASFALEPADIEAAAQELNAMGIFRGSGSGSLDLDAPCDRLHGAVLFTRLLGKEEDALANRRPHPFLDIGNESWAAPYLGYLYNNGYAYGQATGHYGTGPMLPAHFATFCLRALGYSEGSANSDFLWSGALDMMVEKEIISGTLRNRLRYTATFTRGDAVLLAYATLAAPMKEGQDQTLLQHLTATGALTAQQAAAFTAARADFHIAYPAGLLADEVLTALGAQQGLALGSLTYEPGPAGEEALYRALRQADAGYDICIVPGYLVERLRLDGLIKKFAIRDFGGREAFVSAVRDNPYWYDEGSKNYYALPLAFELPCLYYDASRVQNPDWSWLFRDAYSGGVYLPTDAAMLVPLAMHYYGLPYDTIEDKKLLPPIELLAGQNAATAAYLDEHMLDIPEREGAILGIISSRHLPELERRKGENPAYANWQAILPPSGGPITVYYAVMPQNGNTNAAAILKGLLEPQTAAANGQSGYLPAVAGAGAYLTGAIAEAYPGGRWERCRPLHLDVTSRGFYEQSFRNALLLEAQNTAQPELAALEFSLTSNGQITRAYRVDLAARTAAAVGAENFARPLDRMMVKTFQKEAARLGVALWKEYYDGIENGPSWSMTLTFADGQSKTCGGYGLPPLWQDLAGALLKLCGEEVLPAAI